MTSIKVASEKWEGLERKLRRGKSLEQAATEAGIDIEEAKAWLESRRENRGFDDDSLALVGAEALHHGIEVLIELSKIRTGRVGTEGTREGSGPIAISTTTKFHHPDLGAAQELVRAGLKIRQILDAAKRPAAKDDGTPDLFDQTAPEGSNWSFPVRE